MRGVCVPAPSKPKRPCMCSQEISENTRGAIHYRFHPFRSGFLTFTGRDSAAGPAINKGMVATCEMCQAIPSTCTLPKKERDLRDQSSCDHDLVSLFDHPNVDKMRSIRYRPCSSVFGYATGSVDAFHVT